MSILIIHNEDSVWSPASVVGQVFRAQVRSIETLVETPSGLTEIVSDEINITLDSFDTFLTSVESYFSRTNNDQLVLLVTGCLELLYIIYHELTTLWRTVPAMLDETLLRAKVRGEYGLWPK